MIIMRKIFLLPIVAPLLGQVLSFQSSSLRQSAPFPRNNSYIRGQRHFSFPFPLKDSSVLSATDLKEDAKDSMPITPSWKDISEIPIKAKSKEEFDALPTAKRVAVISRVSVLHLTLLSCLGPLILRGALRSAAGTGTTLTPGLATVWTINVLSWHAFHNLLNDWQDLEDDDKAPDSFRTDYGVHALKQGYLTKKQFAGVMAWVAAPGILLTVLLRTTPLGPAAPFGLSALFFYTILFKPLALGEILIYFVWGPLMAGFGQVAAGAPLKVMELFTNPATAIFGLGAFCVIMGKHTDKITRSDKKTLPKLLGYPLALLACGAAAVAPPAVMIGTFFKERILSATATPTLPLGSALALLTLFRELPACFKILRKGKPQDGQPTLPDDTVLRGSITDFKVKRVWPLWFVAVLAWHALTFLYWMVIGSGLEWGGRAIASRFFL